MSIVRAVTNLNIAPARSRLAGALLVGIFSAALGTSPASAQEADTFTGFRVEGILGWDNSGVDFDSTVFEDGRTSQDGLFYGLGVGYDFQLGPAVVGVEAELSDSTAGRDEILTGVAADGTAFTADTNVDAGGDIYIGARAGGLVMPNLLLYVKGGYTHFKIHADGNGSADGVPFTFDDKVGLDGFRVGAGAEYAFTDNIYAKLEYRYSNYANEDLNISGVDPDLDAAFDGFGVDRHQVVLGAGFRF